jgi:hypothetical protein
MSLPRPPIRSSPLCHALRALVAVVALGPGVARGDDSGGDVRPSVDFVHEPSLRERAEIRAVAAEMGSGRIAVGDGHGVSLRDAAGNARAVLRRAPVTALAFDGAGGLLVGTEQGLWHVDAAGEARERSPGPGEAARSVRAVASTRGLWWAGTDDGAFVAPAGGAWTRLDGGLPSGPVVALAPRGEGAELRVAVVLDGEGWEVSLSAGADGARAERAGEPGRGGERGALVDVGWTPDGALALVRTDAVLVRDGTRDGGWRTIRPALPPGAAIARLAFGLGRAWLATDRGLLVAPDLGGAFERARPPAGGVPLRCLADAGDRIVAGGRDGLLVGREPAGPTQASVAKRFPTDRDARADEPRIEAVQRAALAYLDLRPERMRRLREGAARRGLLPEVDLHLARGAEHGWSWGQDESFVSGATRRLADQGRGVDREWGVAVTLAWDLGDAAFHPEEIDVSREAREVIELRDDVLDEISQLYFERRRVLLELASAAVGAESSPLEQARLRLRADELAAGLDAWTGGWFGRQAPRLAP